MEQEMQCVIIVKLLLQERNIYLQEISMNRKELIIQAQKLKNVIIRETYHEEYISETLLNKVYENVKLMDLSNIADFVSEYSVIIITKKSEINNEYILIRIDPLTQDLIDLKNGEKAVNIAEVYNSSYSSLSFYMDNTSIFYTQEGNVIANNTDDFLEHLLNNNHAYHPQVSDNTYELLTAAGWYPGRKTDISNLVKDCEADGIILTDIQKSVISEFGDLFVYNYNNKPQFHIFNEKERYFFTYPKYRVEPFDKNLLKIGVWLGMLHMYMTPDGLLVLENGKQCGLNFMEGFDVLLRDRYYE